MGCIRFGVPVGPKHLNRAHPHSAIFIDQPWVKSTCNFIFLVRVFSFFLVRV